MQCLFHVDCRARRRLLGQQHRNSLAQGSGGERRGERRQHGEAVFFANLLHCLDDDRLAGADRQNLAAELPAHKNFENFARLDSIHRESENNEIRKLSLKDRAKVSVFCAFAGYEAEIFKHVGEKGSKVPFGIHNAYARRYFATPKGCYSPRQIATEHWVRHSSSPPPPDP